MNERELEGRTALVTGGAKGIGRACCEKLAQAGANVAINYHRSEAAAHETAQRVEAEGVSSHVVRADVSSPESVTAMVQEVHEKLGPIDLLVNNAGIFHWLSHDQVTLELWQRTLDSNLTSAFLVTWAVKDQMLERGFGRIVNISSIAALRGRPLAIPYAVSKAGMIALTKGLAEAVAHQNVRINAIAPGAIDTEILNVVDSDRMARMLEATPIPRLGEPSEVAEVVLFMLSERSSFMTGQTIVVSGGRVMIS